VGRQVKGKELVVKPELDMQQHKWNQIQREERQIVVIKGSGGGDYW
jgi:hypothetical protein